jgi:hypothetical protein
VVNAPSALPQIGEDQQFIFDQGHEVGGYAKKLFQKGVEVPHDSNFVEATRKFIFQRVTIFEGAFSYKGTFAIVDILRPVNKDEWDIIEVKSSTKVRDEHIEDVAFQRFVVEGSGLKVRQCHLIHVNNEYVRDGDLDPKNFLTEEDITALVAEKLGQVRDNVTRLQNVITLENPPETPIGPHCNNPYDCPLIEKCWSFLPEHNVTELYSFRKKYEMLNKGILSINDLPDGVNLTDKQQIQIVTIKSGKPFIDKESIKSFLKSLEYPIYCLDFETLSVAIPPFDKAKPYQKIPFQFSIHVMQKMDSAASSHSYLADGRQNFAPELINALKVIGPKGSVLAYNMSFEKQVLEVLEELSPKDANWLEGIINRLRDLIEPFRAFSYYHPDQHGSCSLKKVLPALAGKSYMGMEIGEGGMASLKYYLTHFRDSVKEEKEKVRNALLEYCKLDTEGMVEILRKLEEISKQ